MTSLLKFRTEEMPFLLAKKIEDKIPRNEVCETIKMLLTKTTDSHIIIKIVRLFTFVKRQIW